MPLPVRLITGLGNPGPGYYATRHNAGFWFVDALADRFQLDFRKEAKFRAEICRLTTAGLECWLCKPATYMNESGQAVQAVAGFYRIPAAQILVAHDDIDLEVGTLRLKQGGGHGGHNGLRDIIQQTGDDSFARLRIGVGHPGNRDLVTPYVLGEPDADDLALILTTINSVLEMIDLLLEGSFPRVMNQLHRKNRTPPETDEA